GADLHAAVRIQETQQPLARMHAHVMAALGADMQVALQLGAVEHRIAGRALAPQALGHGTHAALGLDARGNDLFKPGHAYPRRSAGQPAGSGMISESPGSPNTGG